MNAFRPQPGSDPLREFQLHNGSSRRRRARDRGIVHARSHDSLYTWSYTVNLDSRFGHPEILLAGLDPFIADTVLTQLAGFVNAGKRFGTQSTCTGLLGNLTCAFRVASRAAALALMAADHNRARPVLQLIYPDNKDRLPWEEGYNRTWAAIQPLFLPSRPFGPHECAFLQGARFRSRLKDRRGPELMPVVVNQPAL